MAHDVSGRDGATPNWLTPWFQPYADWGVPVLRAWAKGASLPEALNECGQAHGSRVLFTEQSGPLTAAQYERLIAEQGRVPTRNNWHDFFNGLVWLRFPQIKAALNAQQITALACERSAGSVERSRPRDALTIFDENAVFLDGASPQLLETLKAHRWRQAFESQVAAWAGVGVTVFGHALLDQLRTPRMNLTGHLWLGSRPPRLAELVQGHHRTPLVLMGIPGWAPQAGLTADLDDVGIFRPKRDPSSADNRPR